MTTLTLATLAIGMVQAPKAEVARYGALAVYPIYESIGTARAEEYISLDEGLKAGTVVVTERGVAPNVIRRGQTAQVRQSGSDVNSLWLFNRSGKKLLLLAGEMIVGGKQDRIIQKDGLIPPSKEAVNLDVFCVEHGRWDPQADSFSAPVAATPRGGFAGGIADPKVRGRAQHERNQNAVWSEVDNALVKNKTQNATKTYRANLTDEKVQASVEEYVAAIRKKFPERTAVGAVVAVQGRLIWMDRFANNATFRKYWPKLLRSYALEATGSGRTATGTPTYEEALRYANDRSGKTTFEGEDGVWKLVRTVNGADVRYELQDMTVGKPIPLHVSRMRNR